MRELPLPSVVVFILGVPIIFFPVAMFQKVSFMCDQKGCAGTAELEINSNLHDKWYRHFLISGHRCNQCQHFIKMPKGQRRRI